MVPRLSPEQIPVSEFYARWWRDLLPSVPRETDIDCEACTMTAPPRHRPTRDAGPFSSVQKCCSYVPFLPCFAVGAILEESSSASAEFELRLQDIFSVSKVSPLGLLPLRETSVRVCPFFSRTNEQSCRIWNFRPAVCSSYHCVSVANEKGLQAWSAIEAVGNEFEWTLAHEVVWRMGLTNDDLQLHELNRDTRKLWNDLGENPRDFYRRAWQVAQTLTASDVRELAGEDLARWHDNITRARTALSVVKLLHDEPNEQRR